MYEPLVSGGTYAESRRNRFGGAVSDEYIRRYADPSALHDAVICGFLPMACCAVPPSCACSSVAEPPRRIGAVRTRAARGAQPANRVDA
jgi:hypothetical protein